MLPPFAKLPAGSDLAHCIFLCAKGRRTAWSGPSGGSVEACYVFSVWWNSLAHSSIERIARNLFAANPAPRFMTGIYRALQIFSTHAAHENLLHHATLPCLRFRDCHRHGAQRPHRQAKCNPQNHRENHAKRLSCSRSRVLVHGALPPNHNPRLPKLSRSFVTSLFPYFPTSFFAGRVARSAALVSKLPFAKGIKRGGACLFAHGCSPATRSGPPA